MSVKGVPGHVCLVTRTWSRVPGHVCLVTRTWSRVPGHAYLVTPKPLTWSCLTRAQLTRPLGPLRSWGMLAHPYHCPVLRRLWGPALRRARGSNSSMETCSPELCHSARHRARGSRSLQSLPVLFYCPVLSGEQASIEPCLGVYGDLLSGALPQARGPSHSLSLSIYQPTYLSIYLSRSIDQSVYRNQSFCLPISPSIP
jgi:hypothetical protein